MLVPAVTLCCHAFPRRLRSRMPFGANATPYRSSDTGSWTFTLQGLSHWSKSRGCFCDRHLQQKPLQSSSMAVSFQWFPLFSLFPENFHYQQLFRTSTRFQFLGKDMGLLCLSLGCGGIAQKDFHENGRVDAVDMLIACGPTFAGTAML